MSGLLEVEQKRAQAWLDVAHYYKALIEAVESVPKPSVEIDCYPSYAVGRLEQCLRAAQETHNMHRRMYESQLRFVKAESEKT